MTIKFEEEHLDQAMLAISERLTDAVEAYLIGGLAMIKHKTKGVTKDVDIVFLNAEMAKLFVDAAYATGFHSQTDLSEEYLDLKAMTVLVKDDGTRIDIFVDRICGKLTYSEQMARRARMLRYGDNLRIFVSSKEDIFLFKAITSRPADLEDMATLALTDVDWKIIETEARQQPDAWLWIAKMYGRLLELKDEYQIESPLVKELKDEWEISQAMGILLGAIEKSPITFREAKDILQEPDDGFVNDVLETIVKRGLVRRESEKYRAVYIKYIQTQ